MMKPKHKLKVGAIEKLAQQNFLACRLDSTRDFTFLQGANLFHHFHLSINVRQLNMLLVLLKQSREAADHITSSRVHSLFVMKFWNGRLDC